MNPIDFGSQRSKVKVTVDKKRKKPCELSRDQTVECILIKLSTNVAHDESMNPIDFGGQRSKVKVIIHKNENNLVNTHNKNQTC